MHHFLREDSLCGPPIPGVYVWRVVTPSTRTQVFGDWKVGRFFIKWVDRLLVRMLRNNGAISKRGANGPIDYDLSLEKDVVIPGKRKGLVGLDWQHVCQYARTP